ncbi:MAG: hypothetical protein JWM11_2334 [Planctomycetaceae bacterium]|nr:hypothetical protein [Planctomycetaceae bacterium]
MFTHVRLSAMLLAVVVFAAIGCPTVKLPPANNTPQPEVKKSSTSSKSVSESHSTEKIALDYLVSALPGISRNSQLAPEPEFASNPVARQMKQISEAMHRFHDTHNSFPDMGKRADGTFPLSWRVQILPHFGDPKLLELYQQFHLNESSDSAHNKKLVDRMPDVYKMPVPQQSGQTSFHVFAGAGMLFENSTGRPGAIRDILDGTMNTLLMVVAGPETATEWTRPGGLAFDPQTPRKPLKQLTGDRLWGTFVSGHVRNLDIKLVPDDILSLLIQPADMKVIPEVVKSRLIENDYQRNQALYADRLSKIYKAMNDYAKERGRLPNTGTTGLFQGKNYLTLSWRVRILPYLGESKLFQRFDLNQPSNTSANENQLQEGPPDIMSFPGTFQRHLSAIHIFVGPGTPFQNESTEDAQPMPASPAKTMMIILARELLDNSLLGVGCNGWIFGGGIRVEYLNGDFPLRRSEKQPVAGNPFVDFGTPIHGGFPIVMFDGCVRLLPQDVPRTTLLSLLDPNDAKSTLDIDSVAPLWKPLNSDPAFSPKNSKAREE